MIHLSIETKKLKDIEKHSEELNVFFTEREQRGSKITLAGKLAAKDAFLKNIGIEQPSGFYKKFEVEKMPSGRPFIKIIDSLTFSQTFRI
jgi:phosphopantetheinyl transferase (holo-ACP synthase)